MKYIDPNTERKTKLIDENIKHQQTGSNLPPLFSHIEFNLSGLCTRTCPFCPRGNNKEKFTNTKEFMPLELFRKIMGELHEINYNGIVLFSAFSEPLLHKELETFIKVSRELCPNARVEIITNGDPLTADKMISLFNAGLGVLCISMYDGPQQIDYFKTMQKTANLTDDQVIYRERWHSPEDHYGIILTNRGGSVEMKELGITTPSEPIKRPCYYPFTNLVIDYNGDALFCAHDWNKKLPIGSVKTSKIIELWNSKLLKEVRQKLAEPNRDFSPCNLCDVDGTIMGKKHFERWQEYYEQQTAN